MFRTDDNNNPVTGKSSSPTLGFDEDWFYIF